MRSKLAALIIVTTLLVYGAIPKKTHNVTIELTAKQMSARLSLFSPREILAGIYFTPSSIVTIAAILAVAGYFAVRIARAR